ncbi:hypothetical protein LELG_02810 [Lodderomyces elongisporus NRRL YB-4239]|uniref:Zn(2)-C6 fungal-type domain-containing protein n=1 Tax=Lodderomyces elongisporus (strain ATCC 11503 / CBS 2605 / JCM 1781 / NBRC 1676 / NRRL YB-4239) TaxID=379508 RepID=A5DZM3_LODEL|nr:hypothetical protein LELG_02810 [Lodderomyces elongisporus NRRL YB-4239]
MPRRRLDSSIRRSRTRSGCITCRDRHIKCDEQQPICKNCLRSNRECLKGTRLNFRQYIFHDPEEDPTTSRYLKMLELKLKLKLELGLELKLKLGLGLELKLRPLLLLLLQLYRILDHSITVAALYDHVSRYQQYLPLHSLDDLKESDMNFHDDGFGAFNQPYTKLEKDAEIEATTEEEEEETAAAAEVEKEMTIGMYAADINMLETSNTSYMRSCSTSNYFAIQQMSQAHGLPSDQPVYSNMAGHINAGFPTMPTLFEKINHDARLYNATHPQNQMVPLPQHLQPQVQQPQPQVQQLLLSSVPDFYSTQQLPSQLPPSPPPLLQPPPLPPPSHSLWFLDLTNDAEIWSTIIPRLCRQSSDTFLPDCLQAACSPSIDIKYLLLTTRQFKRWSLIESALVNQQNITMFETLLISICLILYTIYTKNEKYKLNDLQQMILNSESKLFESILEKITLFLVSVETPASAIIVSSIQSITILRFFINKFQDLTFNKRDQKQRKKMKKKIDLETIDKQGVEAGLATTTEPGGVDLSHFLKLNPYEIGFLNSSYRGIDRNSFARVSGSQPTSRQPSLNPTFTLPESQKISSLLWYLIKLDYITNNPLEANNFIFRETYQFENMFEIDAQPWPLADKSKLARIVLEKFTMKLLNIRNDNLVSNMNWGLNNIFALINQSTTWSATTKSQWSNYFEWTIRYVNPPEPRAK